MSVAGKRATVQQTKTDTFCALVQSATNRIGPVFDILASMDKCKADKLISDLLRQTAMGQYAKLEACISTVADAYRNGEHGKLLQSRTSMLQIPGIGPKTASFYLLYAEGIQYAVLDTHILSWLRELGYNTPTSTPQSLEAYENVENVFKAEAASRGVDDLADIDFGVWKQRARL